MALRLGGTTHHCAECRQVPVTRDGDLCEDCWEEYRYERSHDRRPRR